MCIRDSIKNYKDVFKHNPSPSESQEALAGLEEIYVDDLGQPDEYLKFLETVPGFKVTNYSRDSLNYSVAPVSYTHLDVYKRQAYKWKNYQKPLIPSKQII